MAPRTRERFPLFWGNLQLTLRLCTLGTAIAALCILLKLSNKYKDANNGQGQNFDGAISTSTLAIIISLVESIILLDHKHRIKRVSSVITGIADLVVIGVGIYSIFEILLSDFALADASPGYQPLWDHSQYVAGILIIFIVVEAAIALLLGCIRGCRERKRGTHPSSSEQQSTSLAGNQETYN